MVLFFFQAEDGIRDLVRSRGLGDVYKRQSIESALSVLAITLENRPLSLCSALTLSECGYHFPRTTDESALRCLFEPRKEPTLRTKA